MQRFVVVGLLLCCCGCGPSGGIPRATVSGRVTLDGVAVTEGMIIFTPSGVTKGPVAGGAIQNGLYTIDDAKGPVVGTNRVELRASKITGRKIPMPMAPSGVMTDEIVEAFPDRYNVQSTLVAEIKPGNNVVDYELTSR